MTATLRLQSEIEIGLTASARLPDPDGGWLIQAVRQAKLATTHYPPK
ncbi:hypothetical protein H6G00_00665 [Leptolyngbya sp. FACHB-541]|nr:hypothetical protein [Leptolyngbya sp. FACHB-541]MBD1995139.1 hypothetical protein [Leptolyngbya sp. FACHB-541]